MSSRQTLLDLIDDLAVALEDHHNGTNTTREFGKTYDRDKALLSRAKYTLEYGRKPQNMYEQALLAVQVGACNSSGLINSLAEWLDQIWDDVRKSGGSTATFNMHPVVQLMVAQLAWLAGLTPGLDTSAAEARAEKMAEEYEEARKKEGV